MCVCAVKMNTAFSLTGHKGHIASACVWPQLGFTSVTPFSPGHLFALLLTDVFIHLSARSFRGGKIRVADRLGQS